MHLRHRPRSRRPPLRPTPSRKPVPLHQARKSRWGINLADQQPLRAKSFLRASRGPSPARLRHLVLRAAPQDFPPDQATRQDAREPLVHLALQAFRVDRQMLPVDQVYLVHLALQLHLALPAARRVRQTFRVRQARRALKVRRVVLPVHPAAFRRLPAPLVPPRREQPANQAQQEPQHSRKHGNRSSSRAARRLTCPPRYTTRR
jgi:hypothetical protein